MSENRLLHLVRHGEVHNPNRVLYGRLPEYHLSEAGRRMAASAADHLRTQGRTVQALRCSPLERAQQSAEPFTAVFGVEPVIDERIIEPTNVFEGLQMRRALMNPGNWWHLRRPSVPSWGEAYNSIAGRMLQAMDEAWSASTSSTTHGEGAATHGEGSATEGEGDIVFVSHQAPIWITHLRVTGLPLRHDPRTRRCALSSITSFERVGDVWREVDYAAPAAAGIDLGAV